MKKGNILWLNLTNLGPPNDLAFQLLIQPERFGDKVLGAVYRQDGGDVDDIWVVVNVTPTETPAGMRDASLLAECFNIGRRRVRSKVTVKPPGSVWQWHSALEYDEDHVQA